MVEYVIEKMEKAVRQAQAALDGDYGIAKDVEIQSIIWFQERIKLWIEMLKDYQSSKESAKNV